MGVCLFLPPTHLDRLASTFWLENSEELWEWSHFFDNITRGIMSSHKLWFSNPYIFATHWRRPWIFPTMNYIRSNNLSLKWQRFTPSGWKDIWIRQFKFVSKTQFLWKYSWWCSKIPLTVFFIWLIKIL